jgi:hypothetical protein
MKIPKVLIFTTTYEGKDYVFEEFLQCVKNINYPNFKHIWLDNSESDYHKKLESKGLEVYKIKRGGSSREAITRAQEFARQMAIKEGYDFLMSIESDLLVPNTIVQDLMKHWRPVVTALYHIGPKIESLRLPCIALPEYSEKFHGWGSRLLKLEEVNDYYKQGLKQVHTGGMGVCLIQRSVFEKVPFYFDVRYAGHSDIYFYAKCFELRLPVFVDTDIVVEHKNSNWLDVKDR